MSADGGGVKHRNEPAAIAEVWKRRAPTLAAWAWERLVNRRDVWGAYRPLRERGKQYEKPDGTLATLSTQTTRPRLHRRGKDFLTPSLLRRHFEGGDGWITGLHSTSPDNTSKWGGVDLDWHGPDSTTPEVNLAAALGWYEQLRGKGFRPLLTDSNGAGSYHLVSLLREPVPTPRVFYFLKELVSDHSRYGMTAAPEVFPKQARLRGKPGKPAYGNWLRLPGRHHTRDHWSRVWDGSRWLDGDPGIDFILSLDGDPAPLIPEDGEVRYRVSAYLRKLPNLAEGQGRDDIAYQFAAWLVRDMALPDDQALPWLEEWDRGNRPPKGTDCLREIMANVHQYGQRAYGSGLHADGGSNGAAHRNRVPPPGTDGAPPGPPPGGTLSGCPYVGEAAGRPGYCIIRDYFLGYYDPAFRRGNELYSRRLGRTVKASEACFAPGWELVNLLEQAEDCPQKDGIPIRSSVPAFFRTWAGSAYRDILVRLEEEQGTAEVVEPAQEQFRAHVAAGLHSQVTLGHRIADGEETVTERRSLIGWAALFAKAGPWKPVRSYLLWCRNEPAAEKDPLRVAVRSGLFSQVGMRDLGEMVQRQFGDLCELYGVGAAQRACGQRVVVLSTDFLADLLTTPAVDDGRVDDDEASHTRAREDSVNASKTKETP
jgi:hypothetical protein